MACFALDGRVKPGHGVWGGGMRDNYSPISS
jgi:hypothetical protein